MKGVARRLCLLVFLIFIAVPTFAHAQVVINEVMYNPSGTDTGREWIELYNAGPSDVSMVAGSGKGSWRIGDSSNHTLTDPLSGVGRGSLTIPAGGYLVVASDPTEFISGEYAGGSYSVLKSSISLTNTGATLSIIDGTGTMLDTFTYTSDMGGNGDGTSLQKMNGSWIAASPTPGASNANSSAPPSNDQSSDATSTQAQTQTQSTPTSAPVSSYVAPPAPSLFADVGADRIVIVGADTQFDARAYDRNKNIVDTARFMWNFGDGSTAEGESVLHHYEYPGRYALVLNIAQDKFAAMDEAIVTAEPARLAFSALPDGGVEIDNLAGRDLDLSDWLVRAGAGLLPTLFTLPPHSVILSGSSMRISRATLGFSATSQAELQYPNGVVALQAGETTSPAATSPAPSSAPAPTAAPPSPQVRSNAIPPSSDSMPVEDPPPLDATDTATSAEVAAAGSAAPIGGSKVWWVAAAGLALAAGGSIVAAQRFGKKEWDIVEEK